MGFGRKPQVSKAQIAEHEAADAWEDAACSAYRDAAHQWDRAAERERPGKLRDEYERNAARNRSAAGDGPPPEGEDASSSADVEANTRDEPFEMRFVNFAKPATRRDGHSMPTTCQRALLMVAVLGVGSGAGCGDDATSGSGAGGSSIDASGGGGAGAQDAGGAGAQAGGQGEGGANGGAGEGGFAPAVPTCVEGCSVATDCIKESTLYDADNYACDAGRCAWLGCKTDQECKDAFLDNDYRCGTVQGVDVPSCRWQPSDHPRSG